jgi:hypothetical protein
VISGVLTLFNWTLKMDSKSIYPHVIRAGFALSMLFAISMAFADVFGTSSMGLRFFESVCHMNVLIITVSGISYFVTAVTEEKDAGTYALLRLAGMNSLAITLGKSTSRLVSSLMLLVIQMPFTFLAITLGGILWQQIVAAYLAMAAWMILVANLALFCSVRCATSGRAAGLAGTMIGLFIIVPVIITNGLAAMPVGILTTGQTNFLSAIPTLLSKVSIFDRLTSLLQMTQGFSYFWIPVSFNSTAPATTAGGITVSLFSEQFWLSCLLAFGLFVLSTITLDLWSGAAEVGGPAENPTLRRWAVSRCWPVAIAWKEFLFFTGGRSFAIAKFVCGGLILLSFYAYQFYDDGYSGPVLQGVYGWHAFLTFGAVLTLEVLLYSSGCLFYEVRQQTQSTLAVLPFSTIRILLEKLGGCLIALIPVCFWMLVTVVVGASGISQYCSLTMVASFLIMLGVTSHLAALLSLYTRWAALPLTILLSTPAFFCLAAPILGLMSFTTSIAASQNMNVSYAMSCFVTLFWTWLFILLPLQIWIRDRWNALSRQ